MTNSRVNLKKGFGIKYSDQILNSRSDVTESAEPYLQSCDSGGTSAIRYWANMSPSEGAHLSITVIVMDVFIRVLQISQYLIK